MIYIDERRTNLALVQNQQLVESRYFWIGVRDFYLPLCKMFKVGRKVIDVEEGLVLTGNTETDTPSILEWAQVTSTIGRLQMYHHKDVAELHVAQLLYHLLLELFFGVDD